MFGNILGDDDILPRVTDIRKVIEAAKDKSSVIVASGDFLMQSNPMMCEVARQVKMGCGAFTQNMMLMVSDNPLAAELKLQQASDQLKLIAKTISLGTSNADENQIAALQQTISMLKLDEGNNAALISTLNATIDGLEMDIEDLTEDHMKKLQEVMNKLETANALIETTAKESFDKGVASVIQEDGITQADVDAAVKAAINETKSNPLWNNEDGFTEATQLAAVKTAVKEVDITTDNLTAEEIQAIKDEAKASVDITTDNQAAIDTAVKLAKETLMKDPKWDNEDGISQADVDAAVKAKVMELMNHDKWDNEDGINQTTVDNAVANAEKPLNDEITSLTHDLDQANKAKKALEANLEEMTKLKDGLSQNKKDLIEEINAKKDIIADLEQKLFWANEAPTFEEGQANATVNLTAAIKVSATNLGADVSDIDLSSNSAIGEMMTAIKAFGHAQGVEFGKASVTFLQSSYDEGHAKGLQDAQLNPLWDNEDGVSQEDLDNAVTAKINQLNAQHSIAISKARTEIRQELVDIINSDMTNTVVQGEITSGRSVAILAQKLFNKGYNQGYNTACLLYTSPSPRDRTRSRMPSSA